MRQNNYDEYVCIDDVINEYNYDNKSFVGLRDNNNITYANYGEDNTVIPIKIRRNLEFHEYDRNR